MSNNKQPNIVFIVLDSARRDLFGMYGNKKGLTPFIDSLAENSLVMDDHIASGCGSAQAHVGLFLGQHSYRHGVVHNMSEMKEDIVAFPKLLQEVGYKTFGHCMASFIPPAGYEDLFGFDEFYYPGKSGTTAKITFKGKLIESLRRYPKIWNQVKSVYKKVKGQSAITQSAAKSLDGKESLNYLFSKMKENDSNAPVFAYTTLLHPHTPYFPPQWCIDKIFKGKPIHPGAFEIQADMHAWVNGDMGEAEGAIESLKLLYEAEMLYADHLVEEFVNHLKQDGLLDDTILIITSDHGEMFGEHGQLNHGATVWEEIIRLPLLIHYPRKIKQGKVYADVSSGLDIYPTIFDLIGKHDVAANKTHLDGVSLILPNDEERMVFIDAPPLVLPARLKKYPKVVAKGSVFYRAARSKKYKYVWQSDGKKLFFNVNDYEDDKNSIINANESIAMDMHNKMVAFYESIDEKFDIDTYPINMGATAAKKMTNPIIQKELKKLGYM